MAERNLEQLQTLWAARGIRPEALVTDSGGSILTTTPPHEGAVPVSARLPRITLAGAGAAVPELELGPLLGEGGMGVVKLATQVPLGREVAVKTVRGGAGHGRAAVELLREARITGGLEHPNVVPIHSLGCDEEGMPLLVMKHVDGVPWRAFFRDTARIPAGRDPLEFHLDVLLQVCNAAHFAHSRGIVHRDLKPDNVMVGTFGEVYVLDWGLAVGVRDEAGGLLPHAREIRGVAGTPAYMAPEMAMADGARISERTDVYLLGAILHECLTGAPRHAGRSVLEMLLAAFCSAPAEYPPSIPRELAAICERATAADPAQRYESAVSFRDAIVEYRRHQSSVSLGQEARQRLQALRALVADATASSSDAERDARTHTLFTECRFGFQQALRIWPENVEARDGLRQALEVMAEHELAHADLRAASMLVSEMEQPPAELTRRLEELGRRQEAEREQVERLRRMERAMDPDAGYRARRVIVLVFALVYTLMPLFNVLAERSGWFRVDLQVLTLEIFLLLPLAVAGWRWARTALTESEVNRRAVNGLRVAVAALMALPAGSALAGVGPRQTAVLTLLLVALFIGMLSVAVSHRLLWAFVVYLAGFLVAALWPTHVFEVTSVTHLAGLLLTALLWGPSRRAADRAS